MRERALITVTRTQELVPGFVTCLAAALAGWSLSLLFPIVSPLLVAILLGIFVAALGPVPVRMRPGLGLSARTLLRLGIVLLGLQLSLREVAGLGFQTVALVVVVVAGGVAGAMLVGHWLQVPWTQRVLIACGFSICGAAAVAAADGSVDADEEEVATAIALVVVFGTLMIAVVPLLSVVLGLSSETAGLWAGASIHEVAQVVAAGDIMGATALAIAVVVKLARVLMLAPVLVWIGWQQRARTARGRTEQGAVPPLVPLFVLGFIVMVAVNTALPLPTLLLEGVGVVQTLLLAAAMFALGCGVRVGDLRRAGPRPVLLAAVATVAVGALGLAGAMVIT